MVKTEVELLKPNFIIFLTRPDYDIYIEKAFGKFTKSKVMDKKIRQIAQINLGTDSLIS